MSRSENAKLAPVGLEPGDVFETPLGTLDILDVDPEEWPTEYLIHDPETGEETWLDHDVMVRIMVANVTEWVTVDEEAR